MINYGMEDVMRNIEKKSFQSGETKVNIKILSELNVIEIELLLGGKSLGFTTLAYGKISHPVDDPNILAVLKQRGIDPTSRRTFPTPQPLTIPAEIAIQIDKISMEYAEELEKAKQARAQKIADIQGLEDLRAAVADEQRYQQEFSRMMENPHNDGANPPLPQKSNIAQLKQKYPRAAAYLVAEAWSYAANDVKGAAGMAAMEAIVNGVDSEWALMQMESSWDAYCKEHVWD
jgi:hypothetical protein